MQARLNLLAKVSSVALGAATLASALSFTRSRRPSDALSALVNGGALGTSLWIAAKTKSPHLWSVGEPSNIRPLHVETG